MKEYNLTSDKKVRKSILRQIRGSIMIKTVFLFFFAAYLFSNSAYAQTEKTKKLERKEQLITYLEENIALFLSIIKTKREHILQQKEEMQAEWENYQTKKETKKTKAIDAQIEQAWYGKIVHLDTKDKAYQKIETEAIALQDSIQTLFHVIITSKAKSIDQNLKYDAKLMVTEDANGDYYIVFGSFIKRNDATKLLSKLQKQYSNAVDIGNENVFGMYRIGIGPYTTKQEAIVQRPTNAESWILKVEPVP